MLSYVNSKSCRPIIALLLIVNLIGQTWWLPSARADGPAAMVMQSSPGMPSSVQVIKLETTRDAYHAAQKIIADNPEKAAMTVLHVDGYPLQPFIDFLEMLRNAGIHARGIEITRESTKQAFEEIVASVPDAKPYFYASKLEDADADLLARAYEPAQIQLRLNDTLDRAYFALKNFAFVSKFYVAGKEGARKFYRPDVSIMLFGAAISSIVASTMLIPTYLQHHHIPNATWEGGAFLFGYSFVASLFSPVLAEIYRQFSVALVRKPGNVGESSIVYDENEIASFAAQLLVTLVGSEVLYTILSGADLGLLTKAVPNAVLGTYMGLALNRAQHQLRIKANAAAREGKNEEAAKKSMAVYGKAFALTAITSLVSTTQLVMEGHASWANVAAIISGITIGSVGLAREYVKAEDKLLTIVGKALYRFNQLKDRVRRVPACGGVFLLHSTEMEKVLATPAGVPSVFD